MIKIDVILGLAAATVTLLAFFARAWSNYRSGTRMKQYGASIRSNADRDLERLQAEIEGGRRSVEKSRSRKKE